MIWRELLADAEVGLDGVAERPELEARWLVEEASGYEGDDHFRALDEPVTTRCLAYFDTLLARRRAGEPIQYVLGHWPFRELDLMVDRRVLIPRPETEVVAGHAIAVLADRPNPRVLDLGTGSGAIALSIAWECPTSQIWATDASAEALAVARANLAGIGRAAARVNVAQGSWFDPVPVDLVGRFDLIVSNPPYVASSDDLPPSVVDWEPTEALVSGPTGLECVEHILEHSPQWLVPGGWLVVEIGFAQGPATAERAAARGFIDVRIVPDLAGLDRALIARCPTD